MPVEYKKFMEVDTHWRKTMELVHETPEVMYVSEQDGLRAQFDTQNKNLSDIQKALSAFLEQKRLVFARFFFLGSDELLQILANTKDPMRVQDSMNTIFEGIAKVKFDDQTRVYGMISEEGEDGCELRRTRFSEESIGVAVALQTR